MKTCNCKFAITGKCFLAYDNTCLEINRRLIAKPSRLGWYAFAQAEMIRLHEKASWMERSGSVDVTDIICEQVAKGAGR